MGKSTVFTGFKFGLLLQVAVGPICIYIFNVAVNSSLVNAIVGIIGVVLVDSIFIILSIMGLTLIMQKNERLLKLMGMIILITFGCYTIYGAIISHSLNTTEIVSNQLTETFIKAAVLTGANPLTVVFWSGVFSAKIVEEKFTRKDELLFGLGAVLSTLISLLLIAIIGQFTARFINGEIIRMLNGIVGFILIYFGLRLYFRVPDKGGVSIE